MNDNKTIFNTVHVGPQIFTTFEGTKNKHYCLKTYKYTNTMNADTKILELINSWQMDMFIHHFWLNVYNIQHSST